jgi:hypothetical protein
MKSPEFTIATLAVVGLGIAAAVAWWRWFFSGPLTADPWSEQIAVQLNEPDSAPVCHRCFMEQSDCAHFCPQCGAAVGHYNNLLPFEQIFSEGEVLRYGTNLNASRRPLVVVGYVLLSFATYSIFAPVYLFFFFRKLFGRAQSQLITPTPNDQNI